MDASAFHVGILPNRPVAEIAELAAEADRLGFGGIWVADSQSIFRDAYQTLAVCATRTTQLQLAVGVTNPVTRHLSVTAGSIATLNELSGGRAVLRSVDLRLHAGERVALMGRNGAGKSTLLRHLGGLRRPTRGRVEALGRVALLLQNPNDYLLHERVGDEAPAAALRAVGLEALADRHPRDLSGGERERLALAIVMGADAPPAAVLLDEPTRGMDRAAKGELADRLRALAADGVAVLVATHDAEFAAAFAQRVVLLADGRPIADGSAAEVLTGGWYFATETARIVGALTPEEGAERLRRRLTMEVTP
jgi:energy-coupling factor transport system ATP-binding protein